MAFAMSFAFLKRLGLHTLFSFAWLNAPGNNSLERLGLKMWFSFASSFFSENKRKYINSEEIITDNKMPAARTNPAKQVVIIAVDMVKVKRG